MNVLITGGAGFIGINAAAYFANKGNTVTILDNFSRKGSIHNKKWLISVAKHSPTFIKTDIRKESAALRKAVKQADVILHLAAQVAVTTSVDDPREDFETNALGTFNVLEAIRKSGNNPILIYSSTNKVYGGLENVSTKELKTRYAFSSLKNGVHEEQGLDFHSPYGCSKGAADQYVRDYSRIYGLRTVVFRQSCIYGTRQFGIEDQGWLAWFIIALTKNKKITIYGTGKQVRDVLYVDDLIQAYALAIKNIKKTSGQVYNIGGGPENTISVWYEFVPLLEKMFGKKIKATFSKERPGDQPIYISDIRKAKRDFNWSPTIGVEDGIKRLYEWVRENEGLFK